MTNFISTLPFWTFPHFRALSTGKRKGYEGGEDVKGTKGRKDGWKEGILKVGRREHHKYEYAGRKKGRTEGKPPPKQIVKELLFV